MTMHYPNNVFFFKRQCNLTSLCCLTQFNLFFQLCQNQQPSIALQRKFKPTPKLLQKTSWLPLNQPSTNVRFLPPTPESNLRRVRTTRIQSKPIAETTRILLKPTARTTKIQLKPTAKTIKDQQRTPKSLTEGVAQVAEEALAAPNLMTRTAMLFMAVMAPRWDLALAELKSSFQHQLYVQLQ